MSEAAPSSSTTSRTAAIAQWLGIAAIALTVAGVLLSQLGLPAMVGFRLFTLAILLGVIGLLVGFVGVFLTRGRVGGRQKAWVGLGLGPTMLPTVVVAPARAAARLPSTTSRRT